MAAGGAAGRGRRAARQSDLRLLEATDREIHVLDQELAKHGYADEDVKLLMTLPGVDVAVAQAVRAAWGDIQRFRDGAHAAAYLGLTPSVKQSADKCYRGPITKRGNAQRWMLVQAAQQVGKHPGPLGTSSASWRRRRTATWRWWRRRGSWR